MLDAAQNKLATLLRLAAPGRVLKVLADDVFVLSYPRSGNTWTRFLLASLVSGRADVSFLNIEKIIPDIYRNPELRLRLMRRPRILKSHEHFDSRYRRIIYIVRDPRDVLISFYNYQIMMNRITEQHSLADYTARFLDGGVPFGSWEDHVQGWLTAWEGQDDFLLVRYEDLHREPIPQLEGIARFLGLACDQAALETAVSRCSADAMRKLEIQQWRRWKPLRFKRPDRLFVRAAAAGQWRQELPSSLARQVEARWQPTMARLSYL
jgi:estrone sulfotransferase